MRDNFTNTKQNFQYAEDEINDLQNNAVLKAALTGTTLDNNMNDNLIYAVKLQDVSYTVVRLAATSGSITLDYSAGQIQNMESVTGNVSLDFSNWPASGSYGELTFSMLITNTAYTLTIPSSVQYGLVSIDGISPGTAGVSNTITFAANGLYTFTFATSDGGAGIGIESVLRPSNTYSNIIDITNTTPSTSTTTGALIVAGGVGIGANLNVGGNLKTYTSSGNVAFSALDTGFVTLNTPTVPANTSGALNIVGSADGSYQPVYNAGSMLHITGNDGQSARVTVDTFGTSVQSAFVQRLARGTAAAPTAVQANDIIARITGSGYGTSGYVLAAGNIGTLGIDFVALENYATANAGSALKFYTSPIGGVVKTLSANITANVTTFPAALSVTGNIVGGNVTTTGLVSMTGNVTVGNVSTAGLITAVGNITTAGNILLSSNGTMGYNAGSGGTVSQSGNKSGGVTLNKPSGEITMQNTLLANDATVTFTLTNSTISARDLLIINLVGGGTAGAYTFGANCTTGSATIAVTNRSGAGLSEAIVLRYAVIRGSIA
jgi:hypothetical protein